MDNADHMTETVLCMNTTKHQLCSIQLRSIISIVFLQSG